MIKLIDHILVQLSFNKFTYNYQTVNHKYNFIDNLTNQIEGIYQLLLLLTVFDHSISCFVGLWSQSKKKFKDMNGCDRVNFVQHINEFIWRQNNSVDHVDCFDAIMFEISRYYLADKSKLLNLEQIASAKIDNSICSGDENDMKDGIWNDDESKEEPEPRVNVEIQPSDGETEFFVFFSKFANE